jgi:DNA-binding response OmpR family regulator
VPSKVLVVEDESQIADIIVAYMKRDGYVTEWARDGAEALEKFRAFAPDLVILDLMLPYIKGEDVIKRIRERSSLPVIMLTAKSSESEIVSGLDLGADDYLPKPFSPRELSARVKALLRRFEALNAAKHKTINLGGLIIDTLRKEVLRDGIAVKLTKNEYVLLEALALNKERTLTREELISLALGSDFEGYDRTVDSHIKNLRKKIAAEGDQTEYVETVHGIGYRINGGLL